MKSINKRMWLPSFLISMLALAILIAGPVERQAYSAQLGERTFPETGKAVGGRFLEYWDKNGGLPQQGYPISTEMQERSDIDGKTYTVQYFERAVFEYHPENKAPYDVLLSQLGTFRYRANRLQPTPATAPPTAPPSLEPSATPTPVGIPQPPEYAAVRARFGSMTREQWTAAGY